MVIKLSWLFTIIAIIGLVTATLLGYAVYRITKPKPVPVVKIPDKKITIIEGWTNDDIALYLEKQLGISQKDFNVAQESFNVSDFDFLASKPSQATLEGFLFPDTYLVLEQSTANAVIEKFLNNFAIKLANAQGDLKPSASGHFVIPGYESISVGGKQGFSIFELVTLASILERETGRDVSAGSNDSKERLEEERKVVAGIFYNRLLAGQALQSDATVNYVTGKKTASLSLDDTKIQSLYNTYLHAGLPPGPISNPSLSSLTAVFNPIKTDYYYFLHKQPSGEVVYSRTFNEHVQNKNRYLK